MFVFIAHAEADQAAADDLKAFLKSRGLVTETETGARGFRHLQASDVVVALWSQKSVFGAYRMMMERRMFDAWADGRLVLVKLDHGFLPVGLRDLPAIDASFETGRQLSVWPQVERAAREAMNRALVEAEAPAALRTDRGAPSIGDPFTPGGGSKPVPRETMGIGSGGAASEGLDKLDDKSWSVSRSRSAPAPAPQPAVRPAPRVEVKEEVALKSKHGGLLGVLTFLVGAAIVGGSIWLAFNGQEEIVIPLPTAAIGVEGPGDLHLTRLQAGGIGVAIGILVALTVMAVGRSEPKRKSAKRAEAMPAAATTPEPVKPGSTVFISYAHADNAAVTPVVDVVKANGRDVWIDKTGLQTGDSWAGEIVRAIKSAGGIMVMCSKRAFESDHVKRELYLADRYKKPLAPVFLEAAQPPEDFEYFFAGVQWLELYKLPEGERKAAIGRALAAV
jgi:hypothetical protein